MGGGSKSKRGEGGTASEPMQELLGDTPRLGSFMAIIHVGGLSRTSRAGGVSYGK